MRFPKAVEYIDYSLYMKYIFSTEEKCEILFGIHLTPPKRIVI